MADLTKVCNHPELFERADVRAPFSFARFGQVVTSGRELEPLELRYATTNPIEYRIPQLIYEDGGLLNVPRADSGLRADSECLTKLMNIWSIDWVQRSLYEGVSDRAGTVCVWLTVLQNIPRSRFYGFWIRPLLRFTNSMSHPFFAEG